MSKEPEIEELKVIVCCCSRFAFPAMQQLAYTGQLNAVMIPAAFNELIDEVKEAFPNTQVIAAEKETFAAQAEQAISEHNINLGLVLTFSYIIPRSVYSLPAKGFYNVHPGPLPAYRGADPIFHQIKNREKLAGVAVHVLDDGLDSGPVVLQEQLALLPDDTYGLLNEKLARLAAKLVATLTKILSLGFTAPSKPQDESKAHYYDKQQLHELTINWNTMDADAVIALMNACNPHNKGAATKINNKIVRFIAAEKQEDEAAVPCLPGTITAIDEESIEAALVNGEILKINFLHIEEGFVTPATLLKMGLAKGMRFENIYS